MSKVTGNIGTKSFNANTSITIESSKEKTNKNKSRSAAISECFLNHNYFPDDPEFTKIIRQVEDAIEAGVYPELIAQGSSGSYFAKNGKGENVGVYKPKNEEPYGPRNPKWTKWFQKHLSPCCFGRSCLLENQGYLSEAGGSLVDEKFGLNVVPKTKVVWLASPTFSYSGLERRKAESKTKVAESCPKIGRRFHRIGLPTKPGSMQLFVKGYESATDFLNKYDMDNAPEYVKKEFQRQFERLTVLDYLIRNTDRGSDNWLIRKEVDDIPLRQPPSAQATTDQEPKSLAVSLQSAKSVPSSKASGVPPIKIAAIDNGLAFPIKHPDEWRTYPFGWTSLKQAKEPYSDEIIALLRPKLENINFVEELCNDLKQLFQLDKDFNDNSFEKQMSVMRGQVLNLITAMKEKKTPYDLVQMTPKFVVHTSGKTPGRKQKSRWSMYKRADTKKQAVFKGW